MLRSSLGFHTLTLSMSLPKAESRLLITDFIEYSRKERNLQIYQDKNKDWIIKFHPKDEGIKWSIRPDVWLNGFQEYVDIINVTINPKILARNYDYITAATYSEINMAISRFNCQSKAISPSLRTFDCYQLTRIDYCVNLDIGELAPGCSPDQVMNLIKRGDIPPDYEEWAEYDSISHRSKSKPGSFYLVNNSVTINCYSKYMQLQERSRKNQDKGYPPVLQSALDAAQNIIRFEIQCKYRKTYALSYNAKKSGDNNCNKYKELLSPFNCVKIVSDYYKKTIGEGDWYTLQKALSIIKAKYFNIQKEQRLISVLQSVNQCRSIHKAKTSYYGHEQDAFKRTLNELSSLGINPVTIPRDWGLEHIPNLLRTYFNKHYEKYFDMNCCNIDYCVPQGYNEYVTIFKRAPI